MDIQKLKSYSPAIETFCIVNIYEVLQRRFGDNKDMIYIHFYLLFIRVQSEILYFRQISGIRFYIGFIWFKCEIKCLNILYIKFNHSDWKIVSWVSSTCSPYHLLLKIFGGKPLDFQIFVKMFVQVRNIFYSQCFVKPTQSLLSNRW